MIDISIKKTIITDSQIKKQKYNYGNKKIVFFVSGENITAKDVS